MSNNAYIVSAVRTPGGKKNGSSEPLASSRFGSKGS